MRKWSVTRAFVIKPIPTWTGFAAGMFKAGRMRPGYKFLRRTKSEPPAYPPVICQRRTTALWSKKIKGARLIQANCSGPGLLDDLTRLPAQLAAILALSFSLIGLQANANTQIVAWGAGKIYNPSDGNDFGQSIVPGNLTNAVEVAGGHWHTLVLKADGTLLAWGDDSLGETNCPSGSNFVAIACGAYHSLALQSDGTVDAFGDFIDGQTDVPIGLTNVVSVACGFYHSMALESDGTVMVWGAQAGNPNYPIGTPPNYGQTIVPYGLSNVVAIAGGGYHCLALKSDGTVAGWGLNSSGQTNTPPGVSNVVAIAAGTAFSMALESNGQVVAWGDNTYGQTNVPPGLSNVVGIACGGWHAMALKSDGTVVAWGAGVGSNTNVDYGQTNVPPGLSNVVQIAAGWVHSLALVGNGPPILSTQLSSAGYSTNGFDVALPSRNGRVYQLEYKNALTEPSWNLLSPQAGTGAQLELNDPGATNAPSRFYRVTRW